jgi:hypothetical protein
MAQSTPVADAPPAPTPPAIEAPPPPSHEPPPPSSSVWQTPPPLAPGATWRTLSRPRAPTLGVADAMEPPRATEDFIHREAHCEDTQFLGRIAAETLGASAGVVGTGMLVYFMIQSTDNFGMALLTFSVGATSYLLLTPLTVHGVGSTFGGNGKVWASLLGGLLLPVVGHVIGYELSHTTICEPGARTAHPRRAPSLANAAEDRTLRWAPAVAPTGQGGAIMGLTLAF